MSKVAETCYRQVIENALSAVEVFGQDTAGAVRYLQEKWEPFARDVLAYDGHAEARPSAAELATTETEAKPK